MHDCSYYVALGRLPWGKSANPGSAHRKLMDNFFVLIFFNCHHAIQTNTHPGGLMLPPAACSSPQSNQSHRTTNPTCGGGLWHSKKDQFLHWLPEWLTKCECVMKRKAQVIVCKWHETDGQTTRGRRRGWRFKSGYVSRSEWMAIEIKWDYSTLEPIIRNIIVLLMLPWMNETERKEERNHAQQHVQTISWTTCANIPISKLERRHTPTTDEDQLLDKALQTPFFVA